MTAKVFVDSNILVYAHDADAGSKQRIAAAQIKALWKNRFGRVSTQVLQEFYVTVTQKLGKPLSKSDAREIVRDYAQWVTIPTSPQTVIRASEIGEVWRLSFWDSLILAAAEEQECSTVLTEDLNSGKTLAGIRVVNPFLQDRAVPLGEI
jgi:predicted nucleic acid-binding protein